MARATHFVFDKTGTLTQGKLTLFKMHLLRDDPAFTEPAVRQITTNITATSNHPVSRALFTSLSPRSSFNTANLYDEVNEIPGQGIEVRHQGLHFRLGNADFISELIGTPVEIPAEFSGKTVSVLADSDGCIAIFALEDSLRSEAKDLIKFLQQQGKTVLLLSGDRSDVAQNVAIDLGINTALGNLSPEAKYNIVKRLQQEGAIVAMVGDGMNDGPVLSLANISIAMGQGAPISQARSDMVLISNDLRDLSYAVKITSKSLSLIRQNLGWAVLYNAIAIPAAVLGILAPWHAAIGMALSSMIVVLNSLRIFSVANQYKLELNGSAANLNNRLVTSS